MILKQIPFDGEITYWDLARLLKAPMKDNILESILAELLIHDLIKCITGEGYIGTQRSYRLTPKGKKTISKQWCEACECTPCDCSWGTDE